MTPLYWRAQTDAGRSTRDQHIPDLLERGCPLWNGSNLWSAVSSAAGGSPQSPGTSARRDMQHTARWHKRNSVTMETSQIALRYTCVFPGCVATSGWLPVAVKSHWDAWRGTCWRVLLLQSRTEFKKDKFKRKPIKKPTLFATRTHAETRAHPAGGARRGSALTFWIYPPIYSAVLFVIGSFRELVSVAEPAVFESEIFPSNCLGKIHRPWISCQQDPISMKLELCFFQ